MRAAAARRHSPQQAAALQHAAETSVKLAGGQTCREAGTHAGRQAHTSNEQPTLKEPSGPGSLPLARCRASSAMLLGGRHRKGRQQARCHQQGNGSRGREARGSKQAGLGLQPSSSLDRRAAGDAPRAGRRAGAGAAGIQVHAAGLHWRHREDVAAVVAAAAAAGGHRRGAAAGAACM